MTTVPFHSKRSATQLVRRMTATAGKPLGAMIEIADRCNEVCLHCYQVQGQKGEMSTAEIRKIFDELAAMGILFLTISGGEPTLRHDFLEIVEYARQKRFAVKLFTNGLTMTRELAAALGRLAVQEVQISVYSHRPEVHDEVTGVPGSWKRTVDGVRYLAEERVPVMIKSPAMQFNASEYRDYVAMATELGVDYSLSVGPLEAREDGDAYPEHFSVNGEQLKEMLNDSQVAQMAGKIPDERPLESNVCGACKGGIHIEPNGELRPCASLDVSCGNARNESLETIWNENENARVIRELRWADLHGCRDCDLRAYCSRCFAQSRARSGDAMGPYEAACSRALLRYEVAHGSAATLVTREPEPPQKPLGPFRKLRDGIYEVIADEQTERDEAMAQKFPWMRANESRSEPTAFEGGLIQIRRPGKKKSTPSTVLGAIDPT